MARQGDRPAAMLLHPPSPIRGGGVAVGGTSVRVERRDPSTTRVSSILKVLSSKNLGG